MPGPAPKPASARARRNKTSTAATLKADAAIIAPELPAFIDWHRMTLEWWRDLWASPMAPEYDDSDRHGLFALAMLTNDFWLADNSKERRETMVRLEAGWKNFGTAPLPRRSLQWEIEKAEEAQAKGTKRRASAAPKSGTGKASADPRAVLTLAK